MVDTGRTTPTPTESKTLKGLGFAIQYVRGAGWMVTGPDGRSRVIKSPSEWWAEKIAKDYKIDADILATGFAEAVSIYAEAQNSNGARADSAASQLIELAKTRVIEIFRDQYKTGFASIDLNLGAKCGDVVTAVTKNPPSQGALTPPSPPSEPPAVPENVTTFTTSPQIRNVELRSQAFKWWLCRQYNQTTGDAVGADILNAVINVLEAEAQVSPEKTLYNRVAPDGDYIFIDMGDEKGRAIHVTPEGWEIVNNPPPIFYRYNHMKALPEPKRGGSLAKFIPYLRLERGGDMLLAITKIAGDFIPNVPWPNTAIIGQAGSGKSSFQRLEQGIIDPSATELLGLPDEDKNLSHQLSTHYLGNWDNVTHLSRPQSDIFCRAITGAAMDNRQLFTNNDSYIQAFMRKIGMSGVNTMLSRTDLFSRTILLNWVIRGEQIDEATFSKKIEEDAPELLGAVLDWLVKAMKIHPETKTKSGFRMGSFVRWGSAFSKALGIPEDIFTKAYRENLKLQDIEAVKASQMAEYLIKYIKASGKTTIEAYAADLKFDVEEWYENNLPRDKYDNLMGERLPKKLGWPPNANVFGKELNEIAPSLLSQGIKVRRDILRKGTKYTITVTADKPNNGQQTLDETIPDAITPEELAEKLGYQEEIPQLNPTDANDAKSEATLPKYLGKLVDHHKPNLGEVIEKLVAAFTTLKEPATIAELAEKSGLAPTDIETVLNQIFKTRGEATYDAAADRWRLWAPGGAAS